MVDTAVAVTTLTEGTISGDLVAGGTSVTTGNVAVIAAVGETNNLIIAMYAASASVVTVQAGDNPPALRQGLGANATNTVGAGEVRLLMVEGGRYTQDNGTIRITVGANTVIFRVFRVPDTV